MVADRTARVLLRYEVDQASSKAAQDSARQLQNQIRGLSDAERDNQRALVSQQAAFTGTVAGIKAATNAAQTFQDAINLNLREQTLQAIAADYTRIERETNSAAQALTNAQRQFTAIGASEDEIKRVADQVERLNAAAAQQGAGGFKGSPRDFLGGQTFRTVGFQLRSIPGGGAPETLGRLAPIFDILATAADKSKLSAVGLVGTLGIVGAAVGGVVLALKVFNTTLEDSRQRVKNALDAQKAYYADVDKLTSEDAQKRIAELRQLQTSQQDQIATLTHASDSAFKQLYQQFTFPVAVALDTVGISPTKELRENLEALKKEADVTGRTIVQLTQGVQASAFAYQDAAQYAQRFVDIQRTNTEERKQEIDLATRLRDALIEQVRGGNLSLAENATVTQQIVDLEAEILRLGGVSNTVGDDLERLRQQLEDFKTNVQTNIRAQNMDSDQRQERIFEIQREVQQWQEFSSGLAATDQRAVAVEAAMADLRHEMWTLQGVTSTFADVLNYANGLQGNLNDSTDAYFANITASAEAAQKASEKWMDAQQDNIDKLADLLKDANSKDLEAQRKADQDLADLDADHNDKLVDQQADHLERIAKLQADADKDVADAIGARDALALFKRREKLVEDLADENDKDEKARKRIDDVYKKQQKTIQKRLDEQLRTIENAYEDAVEKQEKRFADERRIYEQAMAQERNAETNQTVQLAAIQSAAYQHNLFITQNFYQTMNSVAEVYQNAIQFRWQAFWSQMLSAFNNVSSSSSSTVGGGGNSVVPSVNSIHAIVDRRVATIVTAAQERAGIRR